MAVRAILCLSDNSQYRATARPAARMDKDRRATIILRNTI